MDLHGPFFAPPESRTECLEVDARVVTRRLWTLWSLVTVQHSGQRQSVVIHSYGVLE